MAKSGFAKEHLKSFIERIERLELEKANIGVDLKEVYSEAKGQGFGSYIVRGDNGVFAIDRDGRRKFRVRPAHFPRSFIYESFRLLRDARSYAEQLARGEVDDFPDLSMPKFLRRYVPKARVV